MPHSPITPTRRRRSSGFSITQSASSSFMQSGSGRPSHSRKSSMQSQYSPATPFTPFGLERSAELNTNDFGTMGRANGLGSLADELGEEGWDEDDELQEDRPYTPTYTNGTRRTSSGLNGYAGNVSPLAPRDSPESPSSRRKRNRRRSTRSSLSSFSNESDIEASEIITPKLEAQIAEVERFAKQDFSLQADSSKDMFRRVEKELQDLGSQAQLENHTTRLSNALNSLTTHLTSQTRFITTLTQPYTSPLSLITSPEFIDELSPLLSDLVLSLPQPPSTPLPSINALETATADLLTTLSVLNDSMQMDRQTTVLASRRLRAAKEIVETLQREMQEADEGLRWLTVGGWEEKLKKREAARVCGDVVSGFEEVCEGWRRKLVDAAAAG